MEQSVETIDYAQIRNLVDRYSLGVSLRKPEMIASVFASDAVWKVAPPFDVEVRGHTAIADAIEHATREFDVIMQMACSVVIEVDRDTATTQCLMYEVARAKDQSSGLTMHGLYSDKLIKGPDGWKFSERSFQPHLVDDAVPSGFVPI